MSTFPILFRLLLSIALILGGSGFASMGAHAHMDHASASALVEVDGPPCHSTAMPDSASAHAQHDASLSVSMADCGHDAAQADCCQTSHCDCVCQSAAAGFLLSAGSPPTAIHGLLSVTALSAGHASPTLGSPIRPPIC